MLTMLRKQAQSTLIQGLVLLIAIVFIFWGVGANMNNNRNSVATVNGREISYQDFQRAYEQSVENFRQQFGGQIPSGLLEKMGIKQQVLARMIQAELLRQGGEEMGLAVSATAVQREIEKMPVFQQDGHFDLNRYKTVLSQNRLTPTSFEDGLRADLQISRVREGVGAFAMVPDSMVKDFLAFAGEEIQFSYVVINPEEFEDKIDINDTELTSWFADNKEKYRSEPKIRLKYLFFGYDKAGQQVVVSDEEVKDSLAASSRQQQARSLTFKRASKAYEDIMRAGNLDKYGEKSSEEVFITPYFGKSHPPEGIVADPEFLKTALSLNKGELSSLVELDTGYAIIFVDDVQEPAIPELNAVREQVIADYTAEKAVELAGKAAAELLAESREKGEIAAVAGNRKVQKSAVLKRSSPSAVDAPPVKVTRDGFQLAWSSRFPENPVRIDTTYYVYEITERHPGSEEKNDAAEYEQIRGKLLATVRNDLITSWLARVSKQADIWTNDKLLQ